MLKHIDRIRHRLIMIGVALLVVALLLVEVLY